MSVPTSGQAFAFLAPLRGKVSVFVVPGRRRNAGVARFLLGCLAASKTRTLILDTSSFYGSNVRALTRSLPVDFLRRSTLVTPRDGEGLEGSMARTLTAGGAGAVLVDDLNALHHLLSSGEQRGAGTHRAFTFLRLLSYSARDGDLLVFGTLYRAASTAERVAKRSLSMAADLQISTEEDRLGRVSFGCAQIEGWPDRRFSAPLYLEPST
ncbi:MAG: hypothetical protein ABSF83_00135 [Nitrososphaerales archaeon]|jgi:hypothetical protein